MKIEETTNYFANALVLVTGSLPYLEDDFFARKLGIKIEIFTDEYLRFRSRKEDADVAQYYLVEKLITRIDEILEVFELINYLGITKKIIPPLLARRSLLVLKLELLKVKNTAVAPKNIQKNLELNPNKEKILNFIKKSPNTRTKDIIHEFNALSDRTVKRNLGELLKVGLINRKIENKAAYYSAEN